MAEDIEESYRSSLQDLTCNSKPLINMLTMLAEDHEQYATEIVQAIEQHIEQVDPRYKLPVMYLIDSIVKNLPSTLYPKLLSLNIVQIFAGVFEEVDEKTRQALFKLRQTWKDIFPNKKLYGIDVRVNMLDPAWPITALAPEQGNIHVNPKFLVQSAAEEKPARFSPPIPSPPPADDPEEIMRQQLLAKEQELQRLKLELELAETRAKLEQQKKQIEEKRVEQVQDAHSNQTSQSKGSSGPRDPRLASKDSKKSNRDPRVPQNEPAASTSGNLALLKNTNVKAALSNLMVGHSAGESPRSDTDSVITLSPKKTDTKKEKPKDFNNSKKSPTEKKGKSEHGDIRRGDRKDKSDSKSPKKDSRSLKEKKEPPKDIRKKSSKSDLRESSKSRETKDSRQSRSISPRNRRDRKESKEKELKGKTRDKIEKISSDEEYAKFKRQSYKKEEEAPEDKFWRSGRGGRQGYRSRPVNRHEEPRGRRSSKEDYDRSPRRSRSPQRREKERVQNNPKPVKKFEVKKEPSMRTLPDLPLPVSMPLDTILPKDFDGLPKKSSTPPMKREAAEMDIDERSMEYDADRHTGPESKRPRIDPVLDEASSREMFFNEDIDYRYSGAPLKSPMHDGWMKFKTSRPDEYSEDLERRKSRDSAPLEDIDLRRIQSPVVKMRPPPVPPPQLTSNISIPQELQLDGQKEILLQAERQLKAGTLSHEQHQELLKQLGQVYDIQRNRQKQPTRVDPRVAARVAREKEAMDVKQEDVDHRLQPPQEKILMDIDIRKPALPDFDNRARQPQSDVDIRKKLLADLDMKRKRLVDIDSRKAPPTDTDIRQQTADVDIRPKVIRDPRKRLAMEKESKIAEVAVESDIRQMTEDVDNRQKITIEIDTKELQAADVDHRSVNKPLPSLPKIAEKHVDTVTANSADVDIRKLPADVDNRKKQTMAVKPQKPIDPVVDTPADVDIRKALLSGSPSQAVDVRQQASASPSKDTNERRSSQSGVDFKQENGDIDHRPKQEGDTKTPKPALLPLPTPVEAIKESKEELKSDSADGSTDSSKRTEQNQNTDFKNDPQGSSEREAHTHSNLEDTDHRNLPFDRRNRDLDMRKKPLLATPPNIAPFDNMDVDSRPPLVNRDSDLRQEMPQSDFGDHDHRPRHPPQGIPQDVDHRGPPRNFDPHGPPRDYDPRNRPIDFDQRDHHPPFDQRGPSRDMDQRRPPQDLDPRERRDFEARGPLHDYDNRGPRHEMDSRGPPHEFDSRGPPHEFDSRGPPHEFDSRGPPRDFDSRGPPREFDSRGPPHEFDSRGPPHEFDSRGSPRDFDSRGPPRDFDSRGPPHDFDSRGSPHDFDSRGPPRDQDFDHRGPPRDFDSRGGPRDFDRRGPPQDFDRRGPPEEFDHRGPPQGFNRRHPKDFNRGPPKNFDFHGPPRHEQGPNMPPPRDFEPRGPRPDFDDRGQRHPDFEERERFGPRRHPDDRPGRFNRRDGHEGRFRDGPRDRPGKGKPRHDGYEDSRWKAMQGYKQTEAKEEVVIDGIAFEMKVGSKPRKLKLKNMVLEVFADPMQRAIVINGQIYYKFGEPIKRIKIERVSFMIYFHGLRKAVWIDGSQHELRIDAPPRNINVDGKQRGFQIDGRDMMILVDRIEKGTYGGPPRQLIIENVIHEIRFDPPPRQILIDGQSCDLILDRAVPVVIYNNKPHGIRFDGGPREMIIDDYPFLVPMDDAVKVRIKHKPHYLAFGGPAHEVIIDGKRYEIKFDNIPREIVIGHNHHTIRLEAPTPNVKILDEVPIEYENEMFKSFGMQGPIAQGSGMPAPVPTVGPVPVGPRPIMQETPRPMMPSQPMMQQPGMAQPMGGMMMQGQPVMMQNQMMPGMQPMMGGVPMQQGQMMMGAGMQQGQMFMQPGVPVSQGVGLPNVLSSLMPGGLGAPAAAPAPAMDVGSLFQKLVAAGIIPKGEKQEDKTAPDKQEPTPAPVKQDTPRVQAKAQFGKRKDVSEKVPELHLGKTDPFKTFYKGVIQGIYEGIQCSSCGTRFKMEDTNIYREHLDWHFRQNKRGKDDKKVAQNRSWYYKITDWIQFEEFGDVAEKGHSQIFDRMLHTQDARNSDTAPAPMLAAAAAVAGQKGVSCPAATGNAEDDMCCICRDPFEQYWNEEAEDWHLRDAIRIDNKTYHPVCYEDAREEGTILEPSPTPTKTVKSNPLDEQLQQAGAQAESSTPPPALTEATPVPVSVPVTVPVSDPVPASTCDPVAVPDTSADTPVKSEPNKDTDVSSVPIKQEPMEETVKEVHEEPVKDTEAVTVKTEAT